MCKFKVIVGILAITLLDAVMSGCNNSATAQRDDLGSVSLGDFGRLRQRAMAGDRLSVVFFGGSLTWGANASDPQLTSYRALVGQHMCESFPAARFRFWDAAIGGTGSRLGCFRLERDVLARQPDLVFLDFTVNDGMNETDADRLASYEALVRRMVQRGIAVVMVILPTREHVDVEQLAELVRRKAHLKIAQAYNLPVVDAVAVTHRQLRRGAIDADEMWPWEPVHPGDTGYAVYAQAVRRTVMAAFANGVAARMPERMLHSERYMRVRRAELTQLTEALPPGWTADSPRRTAAWYDGLMTRWLDSVAVAHATAGGDPAPLRVRFRGEMVGLFGEETIRSGRYRATLDGRVLRFGEKDTVNVSSKRIGGNRQHWHVLATDLDEHRVHELIIEPILIPGQADELRLESICVAGSRSPSVRVLSRPVAADVGTKPLSNDHRITMDSSYD